MASCGPQQALTSLQKKKFKEYTANICIEHEHEIKLAQALWVEMRKSN